MSFRHVAHCTVCVPMCMSCVLMRDGFVEYATHGMPVCVLLHEKVTFLGLCFATP